MKLANVLKGGWNIYQQLRREVSATAPATPADGYSYVDSALGTGRHWIGGAWVDEDGRKFAARATHTGTQAAATISDFDTQVRTSRLDQLALPTAAVGLNGQRVTALAAPTADGDGANKLYVDDALRGITVKAAVRATSTVDLTLTGAQTVDGVALVAGDRVLVKNQTTASQNGLYVVAVGAWTRALDADGNSEVQPGLSVFVSEGSALGNTNWQLTTDAPVTLGTTALTFTQTGAGGGGEIITAGAGLTKTGTTLDVGAGAGVTVGADSISIDTATVARILKGTIQGDGAATAFNFDHNFGHRGTKVSLVETFGGFEHVDATVTSPTDNRTSITFGVAPVAGAGGLYAVTIIG